MPLSPHDHLHDLVQRYPVLTSVQGQILNSFERIHACLAGGHRIFLCGNGGSAADAEHIAGELIKAFLLKRPLTDDQASNLKETCGEARAAWLTDHLCQGLPAIALTGHPALATAMANDVGAVFIFAQQLLALGEKGDVLVCLSTSGNAENVIVAAQVARSIGMLTIGLTGESGGELRACCDVTIQVPAIETPHVQELHLPVYHTLCAMLESAFFGDGPAR